MYEALSYLCMRPQATRRQVKRTLKTSVWGLKVLVHEVLRYEAAGEANPADLIRIKVLVYGALRY